MPKIRSKLLLIKFRRQKLTKRELDRVTNALKFGIKAWVRAAELVIPVYSGASRASLDKLASIVKINVSTTPSPSAVRRLGPSKIVRRQAQARSESRGGLTVSGTRVTFVFSSTLQWLVDNELGEMNDGVAESGRLITPIPYNFIDFANRVAQGVIQKRLKGRTIDLRGILDLKLVR